MKSLVEQKPATAPTFGQERNEIKQIIDELRSTDKFELAIPRLHKYLQSHQEETLEQHLKDLSPHFANFIKTHLETYQKSQGKCLFG